MVSVSVMVSIGVWVVGISVVSVESIGISLGLWLSISRSLAIVVSMVGIWVSVVSVVGISIGVWVVSISVVSTVGIWVSIESMVGISQMVSIAIVAIESIGISLGLSLSSNSCEHAESGNSNGFHG